ncbi:MAG: discoidin domain-containing protein, partial [Elusimicrobia bacterium]|nr:discoidin domain-containing protein [Elusimicrobiota bacterium]
MFKVVRYKRMSLVLSLLLAVIITLGSPTYILGALSRTSPTGEEVWRINCGAGEHTDLSNNLWMTDESFTSLYRWGYNNGNSASTSNPISGTDNQTIFQSQRWGGTGMSYKIELPDGTYSVKLMMAETYWQEAGKRVFDVALETNTVLSNVDLYSWRGYCAAYEETFSVTVNDQCLDITFPVISADNALISGIEVKPINVTNEAFLEFIQKKMFWYFWNESDPDTGLVKWGENNWEQGYGDVSSIANDGFALSVYTIGASRGWVSEYDAYHKTMKILNSFDTLLDNIHGFWYHYVEMDSGEREGTSEVSTVDSAVFIMGALQAGEYFKNTYPDVAAKADYLYKRMDWTWFTNISDGDDSKKKFVNMGWKPEYDEGSPHGYIIPSGKTEGGYYCNDWWDRYSESVFVNLLALESPTHSINKNAWTDMWKCWVGAFGYHFVQEPPLFTHQYHHLYYDLENKHDTTLNYFNNSKFATLANRETCIQDSQGRYEKKRWGLTGCGGPDGCYHAYGGDPGGDHDGTVAPTAAITSVIFTPAESIETARYMYFQYKHHIWGRYGFCDSFNVQQDFRHWAVNALNNAAMVIGIENYLTGLIRNNSMANQYISGSLTTAGFKSYAEEPLITASSYETYNRRGLKAFDDDVGTRWASQWSDPQWLCVDYGSSKDINKLTINWETAYGKSYKIQVSNDGHNWTDVYSTTSGNGGEDVITFDTVNTRYLRMYGTERGTEWGYSIWEMEAEYEAKNLAINKPSSASSEKCSSTVSGKAFDGNILTRWESEWSDTQWIQVDLETLQKINKVVLNWETAYGKIYKIQVSENGTSWVDVYSESNSDGGIDEIVFAEIYARYIRMYGIERGTIWGYSLWDMEVYYISSQGPMTSPERVSLADPSFKLGEIYSFPNPVRSDSSAANPTLHVECGIADRVEINIYNVAAELVHSAEIAGSGSQVVDG